MKISIANDPKLPGLQRAFDDNGMLNMLSVALGSHPETLNPRVNRVRHEVLKYKPGKHCVIKYWLETTEMSSPPNCVIGKLYRNNRGELLFRKFQDIWSGARNGKMDFRMPHPLAYIPELGMVVQSLVPGRSLDEFSHSDDWGCAIRSVAGNLAALHGLHVPSGEKKTMVDHLKKYCHPGPEVLIAECPDFAPLVQRILDGLQANTTLHDAPVCPLHGDLAPAQIHIQGDHASFVDLDGFCLSHPALDIANFITALTVRLGRKSGELNRTFLQTYLEFHPPNMLAGLQVYQAFIYLRRAMICFRQKHSKSWHQQVRQLLDTSAEFLSDQAEYHIADEVFVAQDLSR